MASPAANTQTVLSPLYFPQQARDALAPALRKPPDGSRFAAACACGRITHACRPVRDAQDRSAFETPAKAPPPVGTPLARAGSSSAAKWSAVRTPKDESALLRTVSSVLKEHIESVSKAASRRVARRRLGGACAARLTF